MKICTFDVSAPLPAAFRQCGCEVLHVNPAMEPGTFDLAEELDRHDFRPDLVFQQEHLGRRIFLTGLEALDCPKIFWAIDPHLNSYWHSCYAKLFDLTLCTQNHWRDRIGFFGADTGHLPWYGRKHDWTPFSSRIRDVTFVGRVTQQRPIRRWLVRSLKDRYGDRMHSLEGLSHSEMLDIYAQSRIAPNESILGEVNFRLFETASCGCVPVTQNLGSEQRALFEPGKEMLEYDNVTELHEAIDNLLGNPALCQSIARAAWERVQRDHLPVHRAHAVMATAQELTAKTHSETEKWFVLAAARLQESGPAILPDDELIRRISALHNDPEVQVMILRLQSLAGNVSGMLRESAALLAENATSDRLDLHAASSAACLRAGGETALSMAKAILLRYLNAMNRLPKSRVDSPAAILREWARELIRNDHVLRPGFQFDPERHLPAVATDFLTLAINEEPEDAETLRLMEIATRGRLGLEHVRMGYLSMLTIQDQNDWRMTFENAMANLRCHRLEQGIEELAAAYRLAHKADADKAFSRILRANDSKGLLARLLSG